MPKINAHWVQTRFKDRLHTLPVRVLDADGNPGPEVQTEHVLLHRWENPDGAIITHYLQTTDFVDLFEGADVPAKGCACEALHAAAKEPWLHEHVDRLHEEAEL